MTREEIDTLWQRALHDSVKEGEQFTRYHFAALVLEEAARACEAGEQNAKDWDSSYWDQACGNRAFAIRALKPAKEQKT